MIMKIFLTTNYSTVQTGGTVIAETNQHTHTKLKASQNVIDSNGRIKLSWTRSPWKRRPVSRDRGQNPGPDGRRARGGKRASSRRRQYLHVPPHELLRHSQHVRILDQFQQVLPQLLLVLRDFSQLDLELLQLLLEEQSSH